MRDIVKLEEKIRALQRKQTQEIQNSVKHIHTAFHGRNAKVRLDVAATKIKADKLKTDIAEAKIKADKLKKEKEEKLKKEKK